MIGNALLFGKSPFTNNRVTSIISQLKGAILITLLAIIDKRYFSAFNKTIIDKSSNSLPKRSF
jgi:hypothetical protein